MDEKTLAVAAEVRAFAELMRRVAEGSQEAAQELYRLYGPHIRRVVRHKLDPRLRSKFDSADFVQDVWASFFGHEFQKHCFEQPEALIKFLAAMTRHKVTDAFRRRLVGQKYNVCREHSLDSSTVRGANNVPAPDPTPSQAAAANDAWGHLLRSQPGLAQRILEMWRYGFTAAQIARALRVHSRTVQRILRLAAERLLE